MNNEIQTPISIEQQSRMVEVPVHVTDALTAAAEAATALELARKQVQETDAAATAQDINNTRPDSMPPTLPIPGEKPAITELTSSTVRRSRF